MIGSPFPFFSRHLLGGSARRIPVYAPQRRFVVLGDRTANDNAGLRLGGGRGRSASDPRDGAVMSRATETNVPEGRPGQRDVEPQYVASAESAIDSAAATLFVAALSIALFLASTVLGHIG